MGLSASYAQAEKPNVVLILADNVGWGDLSAYGSGRVFFDLWSS